MPCVSSPATCGLTSTLSIAKTGLRRSGGSCSNTSKAAPARRPSPRPSARPSSTTTPPPAAVPPRWGQNKCHGMLGKRFVIGAGRDGNHHAAAGGSRDVNALVTHAEAVDHPQVRQALQHVRRVRIGAARDDGYSAAQRLYG